MSTRLDVHIARPSGSPPFSTPRLYRQIAMSDEAFRSQLVAELQHALGEVADISEMIAVLRASHTLNEEKLRGLSNEWTAANSRASALREQIENVDEVCELTQHFNLGADHEHTE